MLLDDVRAYLLAMLGASPAWPVYIGFLPDDPGEEQCIALFETGGYPATEINRETENPTFQTRVRAGNRDYAQCRAKWQEVFNALQDAQQTGGYLPGVVFIQAMATGPLAFNDDKGRPNMTANWRVKRYPS